VLKQLSFAIGSLSENHWPMTDQAVVEQMSLQKCSLCKVVVTLCNVVVFQPVLIIVMTDLCVRALLVVSLPNSVRV
jgi:hypothetical protein